jgi:ATP-binding cassette subfamily C (CFTR/MRP) protein 4
LHYGRLEAVLTIPVLAGGQKARVALARAAYSAARVQLLDDPLSAVDPRVARTLFDACIGPSGCMAAAGCTRVLVTHQRQFLPACDRLLVLRRGVPVAMGSWQEVDALQLPELTGAGAGGHLEQEEESHTAAAALPGEADGAADGRDAANAETLLLLPPPPRLGQAQAVAAAAALPLDGAAHCNGVCLQVHLCNSM